MRILSQSVWKYVDKVDAPDDYTVNFHMNQPSTVVQRYVLRTNTASDAVYGPWAKRAQDLFNGGKTISDPEGKQLLQEFSNFKPDGIIASGPFNIDVKSITNAQFTMPKNTTAWNADQIALRQDRQLQRRDAGYHTRRAQQGYRLRHARLPADDRPGDAAGGYPRPAPADLFRAARSTSTSTNWRVSSAIRRCGRRWRWPLTATRTPR